MARVADRVCRSPSLLAVLAARSSRLLGGRGEVLEHAVLYLRISAVGVPFVARDARRSRRDARRQRPAHARCRSSSSPTSSTSSSRSSPCTVLDLGIAGSAWSTVVVQVAAAVWFLARAARRTPRRTRPAWRRFRPMLVTGVHLAIRSARDVRGVELGDGGRGPDRHPDAGGEPGARAAVHLPRAHARRARDPGAVARRRCARRQATRTRRCASGGSACGCRCGAPTLLARAARRDEPGPAAPVHRRRRRPVAAHRRAADPRGDAVPRSDRLRAGRRADRRARRAVPRPTGGLQPARLRAARRSPRWCGRRSASVGCGERS